MVRTLATIAFIGATAVVGIYVGMKQTVMRGDVMAAHMMEQLKSQGVAKVTCDDAIPVGPQGARFTCNFERNDGATARFEYRMNRARKLFANLLDSTEPTVERPAVPPGTDIWGK